LRNGQNVSGCEHLSNSSVVKIDLGMGTGLYGISTHQFMSNVTSSKGAGSIVLLPITICYKIYIDV